MSVEPRSIGVLYSYAPHFTRVLQTLRKNHPKATITALIPPAFPPSALEGLADAHIVCAPEPGGKRSAVQVWTLIRTLRARRFDRFVVLFDSVRLQLIAGASGAQERCCCGPDGLLRPLRVRAGTALLRSLVNRIQGQLLYWRIQREIRRHPIHTDQYRESVRTPMEKQKPTGDDNG